MKGIGDAQAIADAVEAATTIYLAAHENPDGDAIGSLLAMRLGLLSLGKQVEIATPTPAPQRFDFLPGFETIATALPPTPPDLAIALDCDGISRLARLQPDFEAAPVVADVDHHRVESAFGDIHFIQPGCAATAMLALEILDCLGVALDARIATCLYVGLMTDTGGFRFTNTSARAMHMGATLIEAGADPAELSRRVFSIRPLGVRMLAGRALSSLRRSGSGRVLIATLSLADFADTGTGPADSDGLIDEFRDTTGIDVALLLKEAEPGSWNASLRSQDLDVARVAATFDGGGHRLAAGCTVKGSGNEVELLMLDAIEAGLDEAMSDA